MEQRRSSVTHKKQLAAVVAAHYHLGPGALGWLPGDERALSEWLQRFLADHRVNYRRPQFGSDGRYLFRDTVKGERIAKALMRAVTQGRDNEFFVLMIGLLDLAESWPKVRRAIETARAKRHHVAVVVPWPEEIPPPTHPLWSVATIPSDPLDRSSRRPEEWLERLDFERFRAAHRLVVGDLKRLGVPVVGATDSDAVTLLLNRLEELRQALIHR